MGAAHLIVRQGRLLLVQVLGICKRWPVPGRHLGRIGVRLVVISVFFPLLAPRLVGQGLAILPFSTINWHSALTLRIDRTGTDLRRHRFRAFQSVPFLPLHLFQHSSLQQGLLCHATLASTFFDMTDVVRSIGKHTATSFPWALDLLEPRVNLNSVRDRMRDASQLRSH